jgi:hypothetical protein
MPALIKTFFDECLDRVRAIDALVVPPERSGLIVEDSKEEGADLTSSLK